MNYSKLIVHNVMLLWSPRNAVCRVCVCVCVCVWESICPYEVWHTLHRNPHWLLNLFLLQLELSASSTETSLCVCFCVYVHVHAHLPPLKLPSISFSLDTQTPAAQVLFTRHVPLCVAQSLRQIQTTGCVMYFSSAPWWTQIYSDVNTHTEHATVLGVL